MMFVEPPLHPRRSRARSKRRRSAPPAALVLVAAEYEEAVWVRLTFDRPIDIAGLVEGVIEVTDGALGVLWAASAGTLIDPQTVRMNLLEEKEFVGTGVHLTAPGTTGIVAVDDGGAWAGVTDVELPFP